MIKKDIFLAVLAAFCLTAALFRTIPTWSLPVYDPWLDYNDDGKIDVRDVSPVSAAYGAKGAPLNKSYLAYDSGWISITDSQGQNITITHNLNITDWNDTDVTVEVSGRTAPDGLLKRYLGLADYQQGWNRTIGGPMGDEALALIKTVDGGYALAGETHSFGAEYADFWLVKTDASGNPLWNRTYGGANYDGAFAIVQTSDGGYALTGYTGSFGAGNYDLWLVKTDASGNPLWNKTCGGTGDDWAEALVEVGGGGYVLAGRTLSFGAGSSDFWLVKTDSSGNMQWNKTYGGAGSDWAYDLVPTSDGGYSLAGYIGSFGANDLWLVKTDANGNMLWNKTYGGTGGDMAFALVQTSDSGYAIAGYTNSFGVGSEDFWLVRTDTNGNMQWNKTYGGTNQEWAYALVQTFDGGYAIAGHTKSFGAGGKDFWLVKADSNGNAQWNKTYGGTNEDPLYALVHTDDGGYTLAGYTVSFGVGGDAWLVKTDANGISNPLLVKAGLAWTDATANTITLYRAPADPHWNYALVRIWKARASP